MKSKATLLLLIFTLTLAASQLQAGSTFRLEQDTTGDGFDFLSNVTPFQSGEPDLQSFYAYKSVGGYDFVGEAGLLANEDLEDTNTSHLFLVQAGEQLGLVVVHGKGTGGNLYTDQRTAEMTLTFQGGFALQVEDNENGVADTYTEQHGSMPPTVKAEWIWDKDWTDGAAVQWFAGPGKPATAAFNALNWGDDSQSTNWVFLQPTGDTNDPIASITLGPMDSTTARLTMLPLPPAAWPALAMLGVIGLKKWRSRRLSRNEELS